VVRGQDLFENGQRLAVESGGLRLAPGGLQDVTEVAGRQSRPDMPGAEGAREQPESLPLPA